MIQKESNENKATRYALKIMFIALVLILNYIVCSISDNQWNTTMWSSMAATIFFITGTVTIISITTDKR